MRTSKQLNFAEVNCMFRLLTEESWIFRQVAEKFELTSQTVQRIYYKVMNERKRLKESV